MLQNGQSQRNIRSFRALRETGDLRRRAFASRLANGLTVRLSSAISATILDFSPPQKHVLTACLWEAGHKAGGDVRASARIAPAATARNQGRKSGQERKEK